MRTGKKNPRGFTLIELIMVLVILTVVVAIVGPQLRGFTAGRTTKNTATTILAMAHYARTQAVTEGRTYRLNYDPTANTIFLTYQSGRAIATPGSDFGQPLNVVSSIRLETDIPKQTDGQYIQFYSTGRTDPAMIKLTDEFGATIEVACSSATELFRILPANEVTK